MSNPFSSAPKPPTGDDFGNKELSPEAKGILTRLAKNSTTRKVMLAIGILIGAIHAGRLLATAIEELGLSEQEFRTLSKEDPKTTEDFLYELYNDDVIVGDYYAEENIDDDGQVGYYKDANVFKEKSELSDK